MVTVTEGVILGVLAVMLLILISTRAAISRLEARIEKLQKSHDIKPQSEVGSAEAEAQPSAFDQFLAEDPERLVLSKSEQFAAYREWRKEKGMNWSSREAS